MDRQGFGGDHVSKYLWEAKKNIEVNTKDPVTRGGFTQFPNFILRDGNISFGAKVVYSLFLSYAWHNDFVFPDQDRLAKDSGVTRERVTQLVGELQKIGLIEITRGGQGKIDIYKMNFVVKKDTGKNGQK